MIAVLAVTAFGASGVLATPAGVSPASEQRPNQVLEWNQIFVETLIATSTPNSSSQRLGAIVHTAIFDAYNGIKRRYTPIFVQNVDDNGGGSFHAGHRAEQQSSPPRTRRWWLYFPLARAS